MTTETATEQGEADDGVWLNILLEDACTVDGLQIGLLCAAMLGLGFYAGSQWATGLAYQSYLQATGNMLALGIGETPAWVNAVSQMNTVVLGLFVAGIGGVLLLELLDGG